MRDLAQQSYQSSHRSKIDIPIGVIRLILGLLLILLLFFLLRQFVNGGGIGSTGISLQDAPKGLAPVEALSYSGITDDALSLSVQNAIFSLINGESGDATATRRFGDGRYSLVVSATLPDPKGNFYQVWIVGNGEQHRAGDMRGSGTNWSIEFNDVDNYSQMNEVWITKEITNYDYVPELLILEGTF